MTYTAAEKRKMFKKVINGLIEGKSLRVILREKGTPSRTALYSWLEKDEKLQERFARAMEIGDEVLEEQKLEIAHTRLIETIEESGYSGDTPFQKTTTKDNVQRSKLMIEAIDKILARRNPRKYGSKIDVTSGGDKLDAPIITGMIIQNEIPAENDEDQDSEYDI